MDLYERIESDMKAALKAGDSTRLSVLRMLISAVKMAEIEKNVKRLQETDVVQVMRKHIKQHKESIEQFAKGGRQDLVDKETKELKILEGYLPKQPDESAIAAIIKEAIAETGAVSKSEVGKVMKAAMAKLQGQADGKTVNQIALGLLK